MSKKEAITRYSLIVKKLEQRPCTFAELSAYLQRQSEFGAYNFTVSKRTFQRDVEEIRTILNKDIQYDYSRKVYFIEDGDTDMLQGRLLEAFDTFNALNLVEDVSKYIQFERRRPQGAEHFHELLYAIKHGYAVKFNYYKFWDGARTERTVEPYLLKEARSRWYVVAKDTKDQAIKTFGLDRISELEITRIKIKPATTFNAEQMFSDCFGIINSEHELPQHIVLSFNKIQGQYIKSYPLHHSQKVTETDNEIKVELHLKITHDFVMELLSFGEHMSVLAPLQLIDLLISNHEKAKKVLLSAKTALI
jgi:predicted DNA-binding transcriptional regulator YafY